ncbi:MAG: wax ester/triacylglycerol synthase domain-containing protein [Caldimonas sp.]
MDRAALRWPPIAHDALCARVEERQLKYGRFRQTVVQDATGASWVDGPAVDSRAHVVRERLRRAPRESERSALQRRVGELANTPLAPGRPPWQFHLIELMRAAARWSRACTIASATASR